MSSEATERRGMSQWLFAITCSVLIVIIVILSISIYGSSHPASVNATEYTASFTDAAIRYSRLSEGPIKATVMARTMMGQAAACGVDQERVVRLVASSTAVLRALRADRDTLQLADDVIKEGVSMQRAGKGASCSEVQRAFDIAEQTFRSRGILMK
ncbi:hypothetical protein [Bradyrhizobium australafricanum]|uniref:hypothetical protein n=1 Tax=Bradyrhizobium australafricanum TaxID=2821406 RepID=UPI001CE2464C|nr:hypothetical protein [Bradyrhizobium australafricanum]MCA6099175.1 hypothetical protein [Bradyrhizobium australafricanum]